MVAKKEKEKKNMGKSDTINLRQTILIDFLGRKEEEMTRSRIGSLILLL